MMLETTDAVIDELGGNQAVAALTDRFHKSVSNWRNSETFPPDTYLVMQQALEKLGKNAPAALWRMVEAAE